MGFGFVVFFVFLGFGLVFIVLLVCIKSFVCGFRVVFLYFCLVLVFGRGYFLFLIYCSCRFWVIVCSRLGVRDGEEDSRGDRIDIEFIRWVCFF